jgi:hypothetical protein
MLIAMHWMHSWSFDLQWCEVTGSCSFCWYWWYCWPSLLKLSCSLISSVINHPWWYRYQSRLNTHYEKKIITYDLNYTLCHMNPLPLNMVDICICLFLTLLLYYSPLQGKCVRVLYSLSDQMYPGYNSCISNAQKFHLYLLCFANKHVFSYRRWNCDTMFSFNSTLPTPCNKKSCILYII